MTQYKFNIHRKVTIWNKEKYSIEATNEEEAKVKIIEQVDSPDYNDEVGFIENIPDFETEEDMLVDDNQGCSTVEVYDSNRKLIYENGE